MFQVKQTSTYYFANVLGEKDTPSFTQEEIEGGFQVKWISLEEAINVLNLDRPLNDEGRLYIGPRDKAVLEFVKSKVK
jgi:8-oxo-dGTP diphosphatase